MFTGIIEDLGTVKTIEKKGAFGRITVAVNLPLDTVKIGDSLSVNGACLTVTAILDGAFSADLSDETLKVTTLGSLKAGERVNIEPALTLSKPLGGHLVTGHIDGIGTIRSMASRGETVDLEVEVPAGLMSQIVKKGSIAVDGISLTVASVEASSFHAAIIPHTLKKTTLNDKHIGSRVNVETDLIGKYVERLLKPSGGNVTEDFLSEHGFLRKS